VAAALALSMAAIPAMAGTSHPKAPPSAHKTQSKTPQDQKSVTHGSVTVEGQRIHYKAITGIMIIKNSDGKPYTSMSYVAYIKNGDHKTNRPITFFYNGGPGSSTVWLHMLAWGPKTVKVGNGTLTPP